MKGQGCTVLHDRWVFDDGFAPISRRRKERNKVSSLKNEVQSQHQSSREAHFQNYFFSKISKKTDRWVTLCTIKRIRLIRTVPTTIFCITPFSLRFKYLYINENTFISSLSSSSSSSSSSTMFIYVLYTISGMRTRQNMTPRGASESSSRSNANVFARTATTTPITGRRKGRTKTKMQSSAIKATAIVLFTMFSVIFFKLITWENGIAPVIFTTAPNTIVEVVDNSFYEENGTGAGGGGGVSNFTETKEEENETDIQGDGIIISDDDWGRGVVGVRARSESEHVQYSEKNHNHMNTNDIQNDHGHDYTRTPAPSFAVVHVGPHKTASTAIQQFMYSKIAQDALKQDNYRCPLVPNIEGSHRGRGKAKNIATLIHCFFPEADKRAKVNGCHVDEEEDILRYFQLFVDGAARDGANILMSSEALDRIFNITSFTNYLVPHFRVHVVVYYRRFYDWIYSLYNQFAKQGGRGDTQGQNGSGIISFVEWLSLEKIDRYKKYHTAAVYERYSNIAGLYNISVVNMHETATFSNLPTFFCDHVDGAPNACEAAKLKDAENHDNTSTDLEWDIFKSKIPLHHSIRLSSAQKNDDKWQKIENKFLRMVNVPRICFPVDIEKKLLEVSLQFEAAVTSNLWQNSKEGLESLKADFKEKLNSKLCSIDTERILKSSEWQDFLTQLSR